MDMRRLSCWRSLLLGLFLGVAPSAPLVADDLVVIVNPEVPVAHLSRRDLLDYFSLRQGVWSNGVPVRIMALAKDDPHHLQFCRTHLDIFCYRLEWLWSRHLYAGFGSGPQRFDTVEALRAAVSATPGAIGYIEEEDLNDQVKRLVVE